MLDKLPVAYDADDAGPAQGRDGSLQRPLIVFLSQEVQWFKRVLSIVKSTLQALEQAIHGMVAMSPALVAVCDSLTVGSVPHAWTWTATGDEVSWQADTISEWFQGLLKVRSFPTLPVPTPVRVTGAGSVLTVPFISGVTGLLRRLLSGSATSSWRRGCDEASRCASGYQASPIPRASLQPCGRKCAAHKRCLRAGRHWTTLS